MAGIPTPVEVARLLGVEYLTGDQSFDALIVRGEPVGVAAGV